MRYPLAAVCFVTIAAICNAALALPSANLAEALASTKAKLAHGGQADILVLGDSLTFSDNGYLPVIRQLLQTHYGNAGQGYQAFGWGGTAGWYSGTVDYNPIGQDVSPHWSLDGIWNTVNSQAWGFVAPWAPHSSLQYTAQPGGGNFSIYRMDGGVTVPLAEISTNSSQNEVRTFDYTAPTGNGTYYLHPYGDGPVTFFGLQNTNNNPGVRVSRAANGGWTTGNFLQRNWSFAQQLPQVGGDLVMVMLGANDQNYYTADQFASNLNLLIDHIQAAAPSANIVLMGTYDGGTPALKDMTDAEGNVALSRGVGFINLYETAGNYQFWTSHNYLADGIHFSPAGGNYLGNLLYNAFLHDGATLTATPGDANLDGKVDISDLGMLATNWQQHTAWSGGDFNNDGFVDISDLGLVATNWQSGVTNPLGPSFEEALASVGLADGVPEPAGLLLLAGPLLLLRRRA